MNNQITLTDGRTLGYAEFGDPQGQPFFYFHGWPSSRLEGGMVAAAALRHHLRIIAPDRPGFGLSDFQPDRQFQDWPADVVELADALGLDRFSILGVSGGGPYVPVCAFKNPRRLRSAGIVSGSGPADAPGALDSMRPLNRRLLQIGRTAPWLFRLFAWGSLRAMRRDPDGFFDQSLGDLPKADREILTRPEIRGYLLAAALEAFRNGSRGAALENALYARPWGYALQAITVQVHLWHGELDINVPPAMARHVASAIPNCRARFYADEGHISVFISHMDEVLGALSAESAATV